MKWMWSSDWHDFFGNPPYPFDLTCVEARDATEPQCALVHRVVGPPPALLLDLGCGYGRHIVQLAQVGYRVVGADISTECVRRAARRLGSHYAVAAACERLPFQDRVFDCVFSMYSSVGYPGSSTRQVFAEAYRVTRPGGWLMIDVRHTPRRSIKIGWEKVPHGGALWVNRVGRAWVYQRNFVTSQTVSGQYGFKIERHSPKSLRQHSDATGWVMHGVYGDYGFSPMRAASRRLVMVACRLC